jgi:hypothetical protein
MASQTVRRVGFQPNLWREHACPRGRLRPTWGMVLRTFPRLGRWLPVLLGLALALTGRAVERTLAIEAPGTVVPGAPVAVVLIASTDAGQSERIGMFQADFSVDGGRTWAGLCYLDNIGADSRQERTITAGPAGTAVKVRLRVAFRDGLAGDVDYRGAAIRWHAEWARWQDPPAKTVTIEVK